MSFKYNPLSDNLDKVNSKASEIKTDNGKTVEEALQNINDIDWWDANWTWWSNDIWWWNANWN